MSFNLGKIDLVYGYPMTEAGLKIILKFKPGSPQKEGLLVETTILEDSLLGLNGKEGVELLLEKLKNVIELANIKLAEKDGENT